MSTPTNDRADDNLVHDRTDDNLIHVQSIVSAADGTPWVQINWGNLYGQLTPDEARRHALSILDAANAAETDAGILRFFRAAGGEDRVAAILLARLRASRGEDPNRQNWRDPKETVVNE